MSFITINVSVHDDLIFKVIYISELFELVSLLNLYFILYFVGIQYILVKCIYFHWNEKKTFKNVLMCIINMYLHCLLFIIFN